MSTLKNGHLFCDRCTTHIANKPTQHMISAIHQRQYKIAQYKLKENTQLPKSARGASLLAATNTMQTMNKELGIRGHSLDAECILYRVNVLKHALIANMSMGQLKIFAPALELKADSSTSLGDVKNLFGDVGRALEDSIKEKLRDELQDRYYPFVSVVDGSPAGANAEAIVVRFLRRATETDRNGER